MKRGLGVKQKLFLSEGISPLSIYSLYILCGSIYLVHYKHCSDTNLSHPQTGTVETFGGGWLHVVA